MVRSLRRNFWWLILASGTVGLPFFSLSDNQTHWATMRDPYGTMDIGGTVDESADPVVAGPGAGGLVYTITVTNHGPDLADEALVQFVFDTLPAGVTVDSVVPSAGTWIDPNWIVGALPAGASQTMVMHLNIDAGTSIPSRIEFTGYFYCEGTDPNPANDWAIDGTDIVAPRIIFVDLDAAPGGDATLADGLQQFGDRSRRCPFRG